MSPEIILNKEYNYKTDIWSLGITCIELLTMQPPFNDYYPYMLFDKFKNMNE